MRPPASRPIDCRIVWTLPALSLLLAGLDDPAREVRSFLAIVAVWTLFAFARAPTARTALLLLALAVRLPLLRLSPTISDDVWRYVWEGKVWLSGHNPLVLAPDDDALAALRDVDWARVNHREVSSVYPPLAQLWFVLLHLGGPLAFRVGAILADVVTVVLLHRRSPTAAARWALLPLPVIESAVSGHLESLGVLFLVASLGGRPWAAVLGAWVKLLPAAALLGRPWRQVIGWGALTGATLLAFLAPAFSRGLGTYAEKWSYNGSLFPLARLVAGEDGGRFVVTLLAAVVMGTIALRSRNPARITLWATGTFVLCSPTVHPWYTLWPLAAGLWMGVGAWTLLASLVPLAYIVLDGYDPATSRWAEPVWTRWAIWVPVYGALVVDAWRRWTRPGPAAVD